MSDAIISDLIFVLLNHLNAGLCGSLVSMQLLLREWPNHLRLFCWLRKELNAIRPTGIREALPCWWRLGLRVKFLAQIHLTIIAYLNLHLLL
jgi:hypothetical protein